MIGHLFGFPIDRDGDVAVLNCSGVGYEITVPRRWTFATTTAAQDAIARPIAVEVHTHVTEDAIRLYGFETKADRAMFRALITVQGVGPKTAMTVLGELAAADVARLVGGRRVDRLVKIKGIGPKTAERVVLELAEKFEQGDLFEPSADIDKHDRIASALERMGFSSADAKRAVLATCHDVTSSDAKRKDTDLLRAALRYLAALGG